MSKTSYVPKLREGGFRLTPQRAIIMETIENAKGHAHLTAQEVYVLAGKRLPGLNLATVYRTLECLHEAGLIDQMIAGVGETRFSRRDPHTRHGHLVCRHCESVLEIELESAAPLVDYIRTAHNFAVDVEHLTLSGLCETCQKGKARAAKARRS